MCVCACMNLYLPFHFCLHHVLVITRWKNEFKPHVGTCTVFNGCNFLMIFNTLITIMKWLKVHSYSNLYNLLKCCSAVRELPRKTIVDTMRELHNRFQMKVKHAWLAWLYLAMAITGCKHVVEKQVKKWILYRVQACTSEAYTKKWDSCGPSTSMLLMTQWRVLRDLIQRSSRKASMLSPGSC